MTGVNNPKNSEKRFSVDLTEKQIAILKAGLRYFVLDNSFECAIWQLQDGASISLSDLNYRADACDIHDILEKKTKHKPYFGIWGEIEYLSKLCKEHYRKQRKAQGLPDEPKHTDPDKPPF